MLGRVPKPILVELPDVVRVRERWLQRRSASASALRRDSRLLEHRPWIPRGWACRCDGRPVRHPPHVHRSRFRRRGHRSALHLFDDLCSRSGGNVRPGYLGSGLGLRLRGSCLLRVEALQARLRVQPVWTPAVTLNHGATSCRLGRLLGESLGLLYDRLLHASEAIGRRLDAQVVRPRVLLFAQRLGGSILCPITPSIRPSALSHLRHVSSSCRT